MERQGVKNNSTSPNSANLNGRNSNNQHDRGNKLLPFSIEAILSAPHPKKEPATRKRVHSSSRETSHEDSSSPLSTLQDFTSSSLPEHGENQLENPEIAAKTLQHRLVAFQARLNARKRRKARTCFTNQQIFELERRFVYQKYLSPADRDEIAHSLGISGAQVITWFQNRRAKFRRDLEEMKSDVQAAKIMDNKQINKLYKRLEI